MKAIRARAGNTLTSLAGVGRARAAALERLGIRTVRELLLLLPRRLEASAVRCTAEAARTRGAGEAVAVVGTLRGLRLFRAGRRRSVLSLDVVDESGTLRVLFFNQPWQFERLRALAVSGRRVELAGKLGSSREGPALLSPRVVADRGDAAPGEASEVRLLPVYPTTEGLGQELLRRFLGAALERAAELAPETLPGSTLAELELPPLPEALSELHRPSSTETHARARRRLVLERLLALQARLVQQSRQARGAARAVTLDPDARRSLLERLPYRATAGQQRVLEEILDDLALTRPMRRLLQGEVGSGKTGIAWLAAAAVARAGGQSALLAPTELLAEQHALGLAPLADRLGLRAVLLTGSVKGAARRAALAELAAGRAQLAIGTHALLSPEVGFRHLDLVVIDEQQRFGVAQKQALLEKGADVHALLMTATPIPRTLALCFYGDLEASLLRELPPGRRPAHTRCLAAAQRAEALALVEERVRLGERAFWVCARIEGGEEEGEGAASASAERTHAELRTPFAGVGLELLHGRLPPEQRARAVERFRRGESRVLVSTSMVEVGVDVPEATVMVIEGAERFGLAQLHQLRGRVGRSERESWCCLLAGEAAAARLSFLENCADGFVVADEDLRRRGMGDLAGLRQAGENLEGLEETDLEVELVRSASRLVREDPALLSHYLAGSAPTALV